MWFLIFVGLVALCLAVPLELSFKYDNTPGGEHDLRLAWGFGLIRMRLRGARGAAPTARTRPTRHRPRRGQVRAALTTPGLASVLRRRGRRVLRSLHIRDFSLRAWLGMEDPADTGVMFGTLAGTMGALVPRGTRIDLAPDFTGPRAEVVLGGRLWLVPGRMLLHLVALLLTPSVLQALYRLARA